mmetsp:Transcript_4688/g.14140  ORF Transcript_4688/g.14140 Transcript_4688/m.14140 type:complete len:246 (+) Transcript_4688:569-1306(+)
MTSNLDSNDGGSDVFTDRSARLSNTPPFGFAQAMTAQRAASVQTKPALATDSVCCSMASWIAALSPALIAPNSSMQHTPLSAKTNAPASRVHSPLSLTALHVRPADVVPQPVVRIDRGANLAINLKNWDLPVPGSPTSSKWGVPRVRVTCSSSSWSRSSEPTPPTAVSSTASFSVRRPNIRGHTESINTSRAARGAWLRAALLHKARNAATSSSVARAAPGACAAATGRTSHALSTRSTSTRTSL